MNFKDLNIDSKIISILEKNYIKEPTEVQSRSIPLISSGKNVIVQSQTGTGKTLAFLLPIISKINQNISNIQALILTPTRELADQITKVGKMITKDSKINVDSVFGGHRINNQIEKIKSNTHIIVGTPGRILDHLRRGTINFRFLDKVVIDEADQMLAYGFIDDIYLLNDKTPSDKQMLLFSATMQNNVQKLVKDIIPNSIFVKIQSDNIVVDKIKQIAISTTEDRKLNTLKFLIDVYNPFMSIIFTKSKDRAKKLYEDLIKKGLGSIEIFHGELSQSKREKVLKDFKNLKIQFLISTDISARGIDVSGITHIFNFDVPRDPEYYVHRIGRTGRMGKDGSAITLFDVNEEKYINKIEKYVGFKIKRTSDRSDYERSKIDIDLLKDCEIKEIKNTKKYTKKYFGTKEKNKSSVKFTKTKPKNNRKK